jgi:hypothetical protein
VGAAVSTAGAVDAGRVDVGVVVVIEETQVAVGEGARCEEGKESGRQIEEAVGRKEVERLVQ